MIMLKNATVVMMVMVLEISMVHIWFCSGKIKNLLQFICFIYFNKFTLSALHILPRKANCKFACKILLPSSPFVSLP